MSRQTDLCNLQKKYPHNITKTKKDSPLWPLWLLDGKDHPYTAHLINSHNNVCGSITLSTSEYKLAKASSCLFSFHQEKAN
jgi:hypothetical protein